MSFFNKQKKTVPAEASAEKTLDREWEMVPGHEDVDHRNSVFLNSLEELTEDDIDMNEAAQKAGKRPRFGWVRRILFVFFLLCFVASCAVLAVDFIQKQRSRAIYDELQGAFFASGFAFSASDLENRVDWEITGMGADSSLSATPSMTDRLSGDEDFTEIYVHPYNEELAKMRAGLTSLRRINEDLYGWITVENTTINYPVVQGEDNDYYLDHAYNGDGLVNGSIFVDYRCSTSIADNYNTVLYGHNITSGAMFHDVTKFFRDAYFDSVYINVYTDEGIYVYEPFSVYETRHDYNYFRTDFSSVEEFISFAEEVRDNSAMTSKSHMTFDENDRILTLSTCTNGAYYARYALHAKLVKIIED